MLAGATLITANDIYANDDVQQHALGAVGVDKWGDLYRYAKIAADVSAGYLLVSLAKEANHQNIALSAAAAVGDTVVKPTVGATAVDANEYDEGYLVFNDVSPEGEWYRVLAHESSTGSEAIDVTLERPLLTAATTSSEVSLVRNVWNAPAVSQLIAERPAGVVVVDVDYSEKPYAWLKTRGVASVLIDTSGITTGYIAAISDQSNGAVGVKSDMDAEYPVGQAMATGTAGEFNPIYLTID